MRAGCAIDLVPGTQLDVNEIYLVGFCLPESRIFALIRTWLAPKCASGCVWARTCSCCEDVPRLPGQSRHCGTLFVRPDGSNVRRHYSQKLNVHRLAKASPAGGGLDGEALVAYYDPGEVSLEVARDEIIALLSHFGLNSGRVCVPSSSSKPRSIWTGTPIPGSRSVSGSLRLDRADAAEEDLWLPLAVEDAVARTVTPTAPVPLALR